MNMTEDSQALLIMGRKMKILEKDRSSGGWCDECLNPNAILLAISVGDQDIELCPACAKDFYKLLGKVLRKINRKEK